MTKTEYRPTRKTTSLTLNGECWRPVLDWLQECRARGPEGRLLIEPEARRGVDQLTRKGRRLTSQDDLTLRLTHDEMEALARQARFWEACMDELPARSREIAPDGGLFQEMALEAEGALAESFRPPRPKQTPRCAGCGQPVSGPAGTATVDIDGTGRITAVYRHMGC